MGEGGKPLHLDIYVRRASQEAYCFVLSISAFIDKRISKKEECYGRTCRRHESPGFYLADDA